MDLRDPSSDPLSSWLWHSVFRVWGGCLAPLCFGFLNCKAGRVPRRFLQRLGSGLIFSYFLTTHCHAGSYFPDQGSDLKPLHWKCRVLSTGPPGKFQARVLESSSQVGCSVIASIPGLPWWLSLQCGRPGFDPWVGRPPGEEIG